MARFLTVGIACASACGVVGSASAAVDSFATGADMVGGIVTVSWWSGPGGVFLGTTSGVIGSPAAGVGLAEIADPFGTTPRGAVLRVAGDTFMNEWSLDNNADAIIGAVTIDLNPSISLFDDGTSPDTVGSFAGRAGVTYTGTTAPMEINAFEFDAWTDAGNAGDMFQQQTIEWNVLAGFDAFDFNERYTWFDDTDRVPAPGAALLAAIGGAVASRRRRA